MGKLTMYDLKIYKNWRFCVGFWLKIALMSSTDCIYVNDNLSCQERKSLKCLKNGQNHQPKKDGEEYYHCCHGY